MKKVLPLIMALCIVLSFHYDVEAASLSQFIIRCRTSVDSATDDLSTALYYSVFPDSGSDGSTLRQNVIDGLATFDFSILENYDYYIVECSVSTNFNDPSYANIQVTYFNSSVQPYFVVENNSRSITSNYIFAEKDASYGYNSIYVDLENYGSFGSAQYGTFNSVYLNGASDYGYGQGSSNNFVLDANFPVISGSEASVLSGVESASWGNPSVKAWAFAGGFEQCTNLFANTEGYDASGNIVSGNITDSEIESNENHMYFKDCTFGFCEPKNINNFTSFGGAYVYCRYVVDDWVVNHISEYKIVLSMNTIVGNRQYGNSITLSLDRDGCITVPFSALNGSDLEGFTAYVTNSKIEQDFYNTFLYSLSTQQLQNMGEKRSYSSTWEDILRTSNPLLAYVSPTRTEIVTNLNIGSIVSQRFDPYKIRVQAYLVDNDDNQSGTVARMFDLVSGNDDAVDNSGLTNDNPFEPDTNDPDFTPTVPDDNSTYPQIVINNGGDWTGTFTGGFDPGYVDLKNDVNADPNGNFSQYLDPMHNDEVGSWFMSFVNEMPAEMKSILIAGVGVGVLFGLYRFIRRG